MRILGRTGFLLAALATAASGPDAFQEAGFQRYCNYIGDHPSDANPGFHDEAQGVTHDADHWYFTDRYTIWKVPVGLDLQQDLSAQPSVQVHDATSDIAPYDHLGDLAYSQGYLVIPLQGDDLDAAFAVFDASDLSYVGRAVAPDMDGAWCAVHPLSGNVFATSIVNPSELLEFELEWNELANDQVIVSPPLAHAVTDEGGSALPLFGPQGGDFSPNGEVLYFSNGVSGAGPQFGLHVFDTTTWRRVEKSDPLFGLFLFNWSPGFPEFEEPEGLTVWDLDNGAAPGISGQLHVLLLDNDASADEIWFKHYTHKVFVQPGGSAEAFANVSDAVLEAFAGATLAIAGATYSGAVTIDKKLLLTREGGSGSAVLGQ